MDLAKGVCQSVSSHPIVQVATPPHDTADAIPAESESSSSHHHAAGVPTLASSALHGCDDVIFRTQAAQRALHAAVDNGTIIGEGPYSSSQAAAAAATVVAADIYCCLVIITVAVAAYVLHAQRRNCMRRELRAAQAQLQCLQDKLQRPTASTTTSTDTDTVATKEQQPAVAIEKQDTEIRIFMEGAFDLLHYGHMNAFRLARSLGTHLVVGVNSDASIAACKGAPLMNEEERLTMVRACKFVDEVVPDCPYIMNREYLDHIFDKYRIDYVIHGDDPCIVDGKDVYESVKALGRFRTIPRTEGVSTTDIVGRMLLMTKEHHVYDRKGEEPGSGSEQSNDNTSTTIPRSITNQSTGSVQLLGQQSRFLVTSRMLQLFSASAKAPAKDMRIIYIDGSWDLFHPGCVAVLKAARERGDYLFVGIHGDTVVNRVRGINLPLMNLHERVLSVLGCRYVDDVVIDSPYVITQEMISSLNLCEVIRLVEVNNDETTNLSSAEASRFQEAEKAGILVDIDQPSDFNIRNVVQRIHRHHDTFRTKFERKMKVERQFYEQKHSSNGGSNGMTT